jgi:DMSO/TMAO reductase YedYZ molybdopterin-dependent catalytic subunit
VTSPPDQIGAGGDGLAAGRLPPGQHVPHGWPVQHYGRVPSIRLDSWDLRVFGATADGAERRWTWPAAAALPRVDLEADFHCVTKFSVLDNSWHGIPAQALLDLVPLAADVTHVMVWAEYGYCSNLPLAVFRTALFATHHNGEPLTAEHGAPMRVVGPQLYAWKGPKWVRGVEYLTADRRGFWEERGYHNRADPWLEQRYSYQESPGDGPPL